MAGLAVPVDVRLFDDVPYFSDTANELLEFAVTDVPTVALAVSTRAVVDRVRLGVPFTVVKSCNAVLVSPDALVTEICQ